MEAANAIVSEVTKAISGKEMIIKKILMVMLAKGHILLEDIPGVGKTTMALAFARAMSLQTKRIQFTVDVMPSDVIGYSMYHKEEQQFHFHHGPIFCHLFLADEINRTSSKTQAALLEAMEEKRITFDGNTYELPQPFTVIATQNPLGSAGTQLLPESQMDRFMVRLSLGYPDAAEEMAMLKQRADHNPLDDIAPVVNEKMFSAMIEQVKHVYVSDEVYHYIVSLIHATRSHSAIRQGASPRAALALCDLTKACAFLSDRDYVIPQDVRAIFFDVIAHRLLLKSELHPSRETLRSIVDEILQGVPTPLSRGSYAAS